MTDRISLTDSLFLAKSSIIDLVKDLLQEERGFNYVLSATIALKRRNNAINRFDIETIYINSEAVIVTNRRFNLGTSYEKLKHILNIWSGEGSGWIVDKIEDIPSALNHPMKGLVNLKNKDIECFKWCHLRFISLQNRDPDIIKKQDKKIASTVDYRGIKFPMKTRDYELKKDVILM